MLASAVALSHSSLTQQQILPVCLIRFICVRGTKRPDGRGDRSQVRVSSQTKPNTVCVHIVHKDHHKLGYMHPKPH